LPAGRAGRHHPAKGEGGEVALGFDLSGPDLEAAIAERGHIPLPPYIASKRDEMIATAPTIRHLRPRGRLGRRADRGPATSRRNCWRR